MPRRRRTAGLDLLDDAVETAVDTIFDRGAEAFSRFRDNQRKALPEEYLRESFTCVGCRQVKPSDDMEMVHPTNGFGTCKGCFAFLWKAGQQKISAFGKRAARQTANGAKRAASRPRAATPNRRPPWEILGVTQDATMDQIKKAYRKLAMQWHPDTVPPGSSSQEKEHARAMFEEVTRAKDVMMKVRSAPT